MKHTKGPWRISDDHFIVADKGEKYQNICRLNGMDRHEASEANAMLIAASPDLLEALKRYVEWQEGKFDAIDIEAEILAPAKAAIAKAEGKEE